MSIRPGRDRANLRFEQLEARETPALWSQQSFDDLSPGDVPAGWQQWSSNGVSSFAAESFHAFSGTQALTSVALSNQSARIWTGEPMPADFGTSAYLYLDSLQPVQFIVRGQNLNGDAPSFYALTINRGLQADVTKVVDGVAVTLGSVKSTAYFSGSWVRVAFKPQGNFLAAEIYRPDTNQYLNAGGVWQTAAVDAIQVNDSAIAAPGYVGINRPARYADAVTVDDFTVLGPNASETFDGTPLRQLPAGWGQWDNNVAAAFGATSAVSQSPVESLRSTATVSTAEARAWLNVPLPANTRVTGSFFLDSLVPGRLIVRGSGLDSATPTYYAASITRGLEVKLLRVSNGVATQLGSVKSAVYFSNQWVRLTLAATGNRIQMIVYRTDTGEYLGPDGTWKGNLTRALDVQDTAISGVGLAGVIRPSQYAGALTLDDFEVASSDGDTTPPQVTIDAPAAGSTLTGTVAVSASASDAGGIEHVEFLVDGALRFATSRSPFEWDFDTTGLDNGQHTITVKAFDLAGNVGTASLTCAVSNNSLPRPSIPRHYSHIRIAELAYSGTPFTLFEQNLLKNSIDLVVPHPSYLSPMEAVAPNTPKLIYTNVSNLYEQLLTDWSSYADAHGLDRELAFYHASAPAPWKGDSASSLPVNWFWSVRRGSNLDALTNLTTGSRNAAVGDVPFGVPGESIYIGYLERFREINFNLYLGASNGWTGAFEYATAVDATGRPTAWKPLTLLADTTTGLKKSGTILFDPPADWKPASIPGAPSLYYVRVRTTVGGNPPVATTILGRNYSKSNGLSPPSGTTPAFDYNADANHDGYLNDAEYGRRATGKDARFVYESRVFYPYYGQMRFVTNPSSDAVRQWAADYQYRFLQANPLADGLFVDNSGGRSPLGGIPTVESTAAYSDDFGSLLGAIGRRITPKWLAANTSGGGAETDAVVRNAPATIEEFAIRPLAHNYQQFEDLAALVAHRQSLKTPPPYMVLDSLPTGGSPTDARTQIATLAYYYLLGNPDSTFLMFYGGFDPNSSWTQHWSPAAAFDVGRPSGGFSLFAQGADPANTALTYKVYQRQYDNALVLYRPLSYKSGVGVGTLGDASGVTFQLGGTYRVLNSLGSLSGPVTSIRLRNGEGAILIKA